MSDDEIRKVDKLINQCWKDNYVFSVYGKENIELVQKALRLYRESMQRGR